MIAQVGYSVAERSGGRVMLCAVCTVHEVTRSASLLVEPQNQGRRFVSGLALKPLGRVFWFRAQNWQLRFVERRILGLGLKIKQVLVCRLRHKTNGGRTAWDTRLDLAAYFDWKQVALGFPVWP
jgi:hypothetical protein